MQGIVDANLILSDEQVVGTTAADEASTNQVRLPVDSGNEEGPGNPIYFNVMVDTTFAGGTNIAIHLYDAADDGAGAPDTFAAMTISRLRTVANNQLDAGKKLLSVAIPTGTREWVEAYYVVTGSMTAGKMDAWLSDHPLVAVD